MMTKHVDRFHLTTPETCTAFGKYHLKSSVSSLYWKFSDSRNFLSEAKVEKNMIQLFSI